MQYTDLNWEQQVKSRKPELHIFKQDFDFQSIFKKKFLCLKAPRSTTGSISGSAFWYDRTRTYSSGCQVSLQAKSRFP